MGQAAQRPQRRQGVEQIRFRALQVLGWKAEWTDPEKIIASAWAWHKAHPYGYAGKKA